MWEVCFEDVEDLVEVLSNQNGEGQSSGAGRRQALQHG